MDNRQLAHVWAQQQRSSGKGSNFYFEDATIYSYGPHFPIARFTRDAHGKKCVLFTTRGYSNTTARHISITRSALYGIDVPIYYVANPGRTPSLSDLETLEKRAIQLIEKASAARSRKAGYLGQVQGCEIEYFELAKAFKIKHGKRKRLFSPAQIATIQKQNIEATKKQKAAAKIRAIEKARLNALARDDWKHRGVNHLPYDAQIPVMLRMKDADTIETSRGAEVPLEAARALFMAAKERGISAVTKETPLLGEFRVTGHALNAGEWDIKIGCHSIPWAEIERFFSALA